MTPRSVVITGATGGLGQALTLAYAASGVTLLIFGRDMERLAGVAKAARAQGASVETSTIPVTDAQAFEACLVNFDARVPVDLFLAVAGVKTGNVKGCEPPEQLDRVLDVNLKAVMHNVQAILPAMQARRRGQIALFSSIAALSPHADLLSYSATKAGLRAYGTALRRALLGSGVLVSVVTLGFIDTPMTDRQLGRTPMKLSANHAARIICRRLARKQKFITFPLPLAFLIRLESLLPVWLGDLIDRNYRAEILPDQDEQRSKGQPKSTEGTGSGKSNE
ncbi:MAG: SDR family NAD(P)-dependent oxidoreductase [Marinosulfonomonas sp.]|nr:SDR family NAD(P)-dependent oxidoreductase [Marinosulfonomonas sp.]